MNAEILKRVVRAIAGGSQEDLDRLASKIVEIERKTGHTRLATQLDAILSGAKSKRDADSRAPTHDRALSSVPTSRRHGLSLATIIPRESLEHDMVLAPSTEARFQRIEREYAARDRLAAFGLRPRKTVLLFGPPGCGKSLGAKRLAWELGLPLMKVRFDVLLSSYFGESASNLRTIFEAAKESPCVLLLDECDFIARSRVNSRDIGEASRIVNALLQLMDEYDAPGLLVATTNIESSLDAALFRRFDDVLWVPPPGPDEIRKLLQASLSGLALAQPFDWDEAIGLIGNASAAMVVKAAQDAAKAAVLNGRHVVSLSYIRNAIADMANPNHCE